MTLEVALGVGVAVVIGPEGGGRRREEMRERGGGKKTSFKLTHPIRTLVSPPKDTADNGIGSDLLLPSLVAMLVETVLMFVTAVMVYVKSVLGGGRRK